MRTTRKLHLPKTFGKMGPAQRIKTLKAAALNPRVLGRFVFDATSANLPKQVKGSLPCAVSAYRCYVAFCELRHFPPFPVREEVVTQRSSVFGNTSTYGNYVSHLEKCCYFLRLPTTWLTPAIRHIAKGMRKFQDKSFRFPNFIRIQLMLKIIDQDSFASEFAQARFVSFLFSFRVPSETLQMVRSFNSDELDSFSPQPEKALIGVRVIGGESFLIAKLSWRKNLSSGCILRRPCFCIPRAARAQAICPVRAFWPLIRRRVDPGQPLFKAVNRRNFNCILKAVMAKINTPDAARYSSHAFRRGTTQGLKETGSPWSVVATSGLWHSPILPRIC